jgi:hypothetical protein
VVPFLGWGAFGGSAGAVLRILSAAWTEPYAANISLNGTLDRILPYGAGPLRTQLVLGLVAGTTLLVTLLGAGASWLHHSTLVFPGAMLGSEAVAILATLLYGAAAGWHRALELGGAGAASAAAAAGTCALGAVWIQALWRLFRRPEREDPELH